MASKEDLVQYVVIRSDLRHKNQWSCGAIVAQACHACVAATFTSLLTPNTEAYLSDLDHMHKIILQIQDEPSLRALSQKLTDSQVTHKLWIEQPESTATCLATSPAPRQHLASHFKSLKLFL